MADTDILTFKVGNLIIKIDRSKCISCGTCSALAPNTFEMDENLIAQVKESGPYDDHETIKLAQASCATGAITVEAAEETVIPEATLEQPEEKPEIHQR